MNYLKMTNKDDTPLPSVVSSDAWMLDDSERKDMLVKIASAVVDNVDLAYNFSKHTQKDKVNAYAHEVLSLGLLYLEFHYAMKEGDGDRVF